MKATEYDARIKQLREAMDANGANKTPAGRALLDQCTAELRDYLDLRGVTLTDPNQLRAAVAISYFIAEMAQQISKDAEKIAINTLEVLSQFA